MEPLAPLRPAGLNYCAFRKGSASSILEPLAADLVAVWKSQTSSETPWKRYWGRKGDQLVEAPERAGPLRRWAGMGSAVVGPRIPITLYVIRNLAYLVKSMIRSFKDRNTKRFFEGQWVGAFHGFADQAARRLTLLDNAETLRDLAALPSNRLEALRGGRAGQHSIRINRQWRVCFRWTDDGPRDVAIVDYH